MVCVEQKSWQIGGFGKIVEIDESKFVKRKYDRGKARVYEESLWVLGGICRETGECFMRMHTNKDNFAEVERKYL